MNDPIHDDEPDTSATVVGTLLAAECPQWNDAPLSYLATSGTDNAMWRVHLEGEPDVVVRLPRRPGSAAMVEHELSVLRSVERSALAVSTPSLRHAGEPHEIFPHRWSVLEWIDGVDAWSARHELAPHRPAVDLATDLAASVTAIAEISDVATAPRLPGQRGGPLGPLLDQLQRWLDQPGAAERIDCRAVARLVDQARELVDVEVVPGFVHGDLIPGNVLVDGGRLAAIIDWGGAGWGDPAQDLSPAWSVLDGRARQVFRAAVEVDEASWIRGRIFELEHAIGGVLYYEPRHHVLGDIMARTLDRILDDPC